MSDVGILERPSAVDYIQHHLHHATMGLPVNVDTIIVSWILGAALVLLGWWIGRRLTSGAPTGLQNTLESVVEFVNDQVKSLYPKSDPLVGPLALTIFLWVIVMNAMDIIPVDLVPMGVQWFGHAATGAPYDEIHFRLVPTAGLAMPFAMAISVFLLTIVYGIRSKGVPGYLKGFATHPFGIYLAPINIVMSIVEEIAKPLSLALRLFGNMFAGELVFMLIALLGYTWFMLPLQLALGWTWTVFETLIILIQAFIFMLLSVVYLALATSEEH